MHPNPRRIAPIVLVLLALAALGYWYFGVRPSQTSSDSLSASGVIEITQVQVGAELGGKVAEVRVAEGDLVKGGDILVQLDTALLQAQRAQAAAALEVAKANSDAAQSNADAAQSTVDAAQSSVDAAQASQDAAQASLDLLQAGASAGQLAAAQAQLAQAEANRRAAEASFAALTAGALPEDIIATRLRLDLARQEYYNLILALTSQQISEATTAGATAQTNLEQAKTRLAELKEDSAMPASALEAASAAVSDALAADEAAQAALTAVQDAALPFYRQVEAVRLSWEIARLNLSQARARQTLLLKSSDMPQAALDAARADVDAAQELADDSQAAYEALHTSAQGDRLRSAWNNAQATLSDLNRLGQGAAATVETVIYQLDVMAALSDLASANLSLIQSGARSEQVRVAQAQLAAAQAQFAAAQAQLEAAQARAQAAQAQAAAAQAQVDAAQAAINILDVQIGKLTITAPTDGVVLTRIIETGEIAAPGSTLLILGQTADKTITVYIPEDRYGWLSLGQAAEVSVDSFPGVSFKATVVNIAGQAEFTPRNVQTVEGRKNTVFAIELRVDDPDDRLKAGMPADVVFK